MMVIDAGGGTVDLSSYTFTSTTPLSASEIAPPGCECFTSLMFDRGTEEVAQVS